MPYGQLLAALLAAEDDWLHGSSQPGRFVRWQRLSSVIKIKNVKTCSVHSL